MSWKMDTTHSEVQFKVKHLVISTVTGHFASFEGQVSETKPDDFDQSTLSFSLDVASISTNQTDRDNHLKSADFFDVEKFPKITFTEGKLSKKSESEYRLDGVLTIKETSKPIVLDVAYGGTMKDPWGNTKAGFEVQGKINRKDFGITWNAALESGGLLVAEDVKFEINIQLVKG